MDSPIGYKPDSTISDTELERQQQYMQEEFYLAQWNNTTLSSSPKRPNLDDRIHRMLSDSPTGNANANAPPAYTPEGYPYPMHHDNQNDMFYQNMYHTNLHQMPPPPVHLQSPRYQQSMNHHGSYEEFGSFASPRNFVNNSNLVEITQQKRERQRVGSSQAVQVGNVLEIVPSNKIAESPEVAKELPVETTKLTAEAIKQRAEKRSQAKLKRNVDRERKRLAKHARKEKLRQEIQRYFEAGVAADHSDDENLIPLRTVNIAATADRSIVKRAKNDLTSKKVLFSDGILPGETTSEDDEAAEEDENCSVKKQRRKKFRKKRLMQLRKQQSATTANGDSNDTSNDPELEKAPPPPPPIDSAPPAHLKQPRLKKITAEMFAAFPVNLEPLYYYISKMHQANGYHQVVPPTRLNDRFNYYKNKPPPSVGQSPGYLQQQRSAISKPPNSGKISTSRIAL